MEEFREAGGVEISLWNFIAGYCYRFSSQGALVDDAIVHSVTRFLMRGFPSLFHFYHLLTNVIGMVASARY